MNKRLIKILGASTLALIMGAGVLCGTIIPMNSACATTSAGATSASNSGDPAALAQSADSAQAEWAENILSGDLNLDPENDPVLGTTENGLEIKFHGKALTGEWDYDTFMTNYFGSTSSTYQSGTFYGLSGYLYITLGGYNWIIIGRNSSLNAISATNTYAQCATTVTNFLKFSSYSTYANYLNSQRETTTPAGSAISSDNSKQILNTVSTATRTYSYNLSSYGAPVATTEIPSGCVLCLCAGTTGNSAYDSTSPYYSYFPNSTLDTAMTTVYNNIKSAAGGAIQSTSLTTYGSNSSGTMTTYTHSEYLFPLAATIDGTSQNFCVETYLTSATARDINAEWWLRSGTPSYYYYAYYVYTNGGANYVTHAGDSYGVRPAFVLKL